MKIFCDKYFVKIFFNSDKRTLHYCISHVRLQQSLKKSKIPELNRVVRRHSCAHINATLQILRQKKCCAVGHGQVRHRPFGRVNRLASLGTSAS